MAEENEKPPAWASEFQGHYTVLFSDDRESVRFIAWGDLIPMRLTFGWVQELPDGVARTELCLAPRLGDGDPEDCLELARRLATSLNRERFWRLEFIEYEDEITTISKLSPQACHFNPSPALNLARLHDGEDDDSPWPQAGSGSGFSAPNKP